MMGVSDRTGSDGPEDAGADQAASKATVMPSAPWISRSPREIPMVTGMSALAGDYHVLRCMVLQLGRESSRVSHSTQPCGLLRPRYARQPFCSASRQSSIDPCRVLLGKEHVGGKSRKPAYRDVVPVSRDFAISIFSRNSQRLGKPWRNVKQLTLSRLSYLFARGFHFSLARLNGGRIFHWAGLC